MHKNTTDIKNHINSQYDESYDRVKYLKDQYKGETAYILASGPSFNEIPQEILQNKLQDERESKRIELEKMLRAKTKKKGGKLKKGGKV